ncbi:hypothetical protein AMC94_23230 [Pseudomonas amygdali pv. aesculi]|nr:hypothetical protein PSYAE_26065 [Pseudomonas amygdali pv. aesculi str. 0893_23]KPW17168.1 Uncharacterized protein ALO90_03312 [Pseudomonas amygdali pv. aesculi]KWS93139.1 hypothetical protein AL049_18825 [Pseudomonas syringae pv. cerasicola]RMS77590.1 hypothetical protein ALP61_03487 [Pseudomonas savastanoi]KWT12333.1 hypothetical protein AL041_01365 [Pseudomonas amygdali pv. aesculi]
MSHKPHFILAQRYRMPYVARTQFILTRGGEQRYFPAPPIKDPTQYSQDWATANFNKINQPFWADEEAHKASSND